MPTSGTYGFSPSLGELGIYAFGMCGIRPTELLAEHMESLRMAANLMLGRWSSQGVNLWQVDLQTVPLVQGTSTYSLPTNTIAILDAYITVNSGSATINRLILPVSRSEYASYPNPQMTGQPTVYWFDRLLSGTLTIWPVPDGNEVSVSYYRLRQTQDANFTSGQTVEVPVYALEAAATGLAARLSVIWAPDRAEAMKALADEAWQVFADQNVETAQFYVSPTVSSYWRA
jgi:hypothetical protein